MTKQERQEKALLCTSGSIVKREHKVTHKGRIFLKLWNAILSQLAPLGHTVYARGHGSAFPVLLAFFHSTWLVFNPGCTGATTPYVRITGMYVTSICRSRSLYLFLCSFLRSTDIQRQLVGEIMQNVSSYWSRSRFEELHSICRWQRTKP